MDKINSFFETFGISIWLVLAGFFGALLSLKDKKGITKKEKIISVFSGVLIANFMTPLVFEYLKIDKGAMGGIAFVLGYSGLEVMKWMILQIKVKFKKND